MRRHSLLTAFLLSATLALGLASPAPCGPPPTVEPKRGFQGFEGTILYGEETLTAEKAKRFGAVIPQGIRKKDLVTFRYPRVLIEQNQGQKEVNRASKITFLKPDGSKLREIVAKEIAPEEPFGITTNVSSNGRFLAVTTALPKAERTEQVGTNTQVIDSEGRPIWDIRQPYGEVILSPDGSYMLAYSDGEYSLAPLFVYSKKGRIATIEKDNDPWRATFSPDGTFLAIAYLRLEDDPSMSKGLDRCVVDLVAVDRAGRILWSNYSVARGLVAYPTGLRVDAVGKTVLSGIDNNHVTHEWTFSTSGKLLNLETRPLRSPR